MALVVEGLNLRPEKMDTLSRALAGAGIDVFRLSLRGQGYGSFQNVTAKRWMSETRQGFEEVSRRARRFAVPVYFLGFSLGGLLGEVLLNAGGDSPHARFDRVVLLAPAIALRPIVYLVKPFFLLGRGFTLPSANSPEYRAHAGTPMAAYEALFELLRLLRESHYRRANVPTLLFIRGNDELVSPRGLRSVIRNHLLSNWSLSVLPDGGARGYPRHLIVDENTLGQAEWELMKARILRFLLHAPGTASRQNLSDKCGGSSAARGRREGGKK